MEISPNQKRFWNCRTSYKKHPFFFTSEAVLKMSKEANTGDIESTCTRVTKPTSKKVTNAEVDLNCQWTFNWLWIVLIAYLYPRAIYLIPIPMFCLVSWFLYCSTCSKSTTNMKPNGNISIEWAKVLSFVWEKVLVRR